MIHFPFYDYFGFDLCESCLKKLDNKLNKFFKELKGGKKRK